MNFYCTTLLYNTLTMEKNTHKQNALSLKVKMEILQAINKDGQTKAEICIKFSIPNFTLLIIKNNDILIKNYEANKSEPDRK